MTTQIDAIIAALSIARDDAEVSDDLEWRVSACNRWIAMLPGNWRGRWRHLKLQAETSDCVPREAFIGHVNATLAYLTAYRDHLHTGTTQAPWRRNIGNEDAGKKPPAPRKSPLKLVD